MLKAEEMLKQDSERMTEPVVDYNSARMSHIRRIFESLELPEKYLTAFLENPSKDLPYHGNQHQIVVASLAYRGANIHLLDKLSRKAVFLAGLFHDYDYSLEKTEDENIETAARFALTLLNAEGRLSLMVASIIRESRFPHSAPTSLISALVQDADSLMITQPDFSEFIKGLELENPARVIDPFFPGQDSLNTTWAKQLYKTSSDLFTSGKRILDHDSAVIVGNTLHTQALSSAGFLVDESMLEDLETIWELGFKTSFSCGGDHDDISPGRYALLDGYVAFRDVTESQLEVIRHSAGMIRRDVEQVVSKSGDHLVIVRFSWEERIRFFESLISSTRR